MKPLVVVGVILIILGGLALAYQGISYTDRETVVDLGPIEATAEKERNIPLPPILGGLLLAGGIALVVIGSRR
jgi:uncharacterized membrane protein